MTNTNEKDRSHLKIVENKTFENKIIEKKADTPLDTGDGSIEGVEAMYDILSRDLTAQYYSDWGDYVSGDLGREDFIMSLIEFDDCDTVHPFFMFDGAPAPTAREPMFTPANYGILDFAKIPKENEDNLLWALECERRNYRVVFIPKEFVIQLENQVHKFFEMIIKESEASLPEKFDPAAIGAYIRELKIVFINEALECGLLDNGYMDDDDFDDDDFDDDDDDFDDEDFDDDDFDDDEDLDFNDDESGDGLDWSEDDIEALTPEDIEMINTRVDEKMKNASLASLDCGRYKITLLLS